MSLSSRLETPADETEDNYSFKVHAWTHTDAYESRVRSRALFNLEKNLIAEQIHSFPTELAM